MFLNTGILKEIILGHYVSKCMFQSISPSYVLNKITFQSQIHFGKAIYLDLTTSQRHLYIKVLRNPVINLFHFTYLNIFQISLTLETSFTLHLVFHRTSIPQNTI